MTRMVGQAAISDAGQLPPAIVAGAPSPLSCLIQKSPKSSHLFSILHSDLPLWLTRVLSAACSSRVFQQLQHGRPRYAHQQFL